MRLTTQQQQIIRQVITRRDPEAEIYLFGSRVDDTRRGGDIDLLILSECLGFEDLWPMRRDILDQIGWQKLDIVLDNKTDPSKPISKVALLEGVSL